MPGQELQTLNLITFSCTIAAMRYSISILILCCLTACESIELGSLKDRLITSEENVAPVAIAQPDTKPEQIDGGDLLDRPTASSGPLGTTIVSLGTPTEPGMWLKTPLVANSRPGKVRWKGNNLAVTLIPIEGTSGAGSRISLSAMQALGMMLTELLEVQVFAD